MTQLLQLTGNATASQSMAVQTFALAYFDVFRAAAVLGVLVPLVLLMKRSVAEKGAHIGAE